MVSPDSSAATASGSSRPSEIGAVQGVSGLERCDDAVRVRRREADEPGLRRDDRVSAGGAEMRRARRADGADTGLARHLDRERHRPIAGQVAKPVIAIEHRRRCRRALRRHGGRAVDATAAQHRRVVSDEPYAVAVDAKPRGVHQRPGRRRRRRLVGTGGAECLMAARGEQFDGKQNRIVHGASFRRS